MNDTCLIHTWMGQMIIPAMDFLLVGDRDWSWVVACCNRYEWGVDLPFVAHDGESDSWVCRATNTVSLLSPNKASNARFIFPPCSLGTTSISHRTLNHIVSCRPCTSSTDIVALSGRFRFVDGIVNGLKSLRSFPISKVFGRVSHTYP